MDGLSVGLGSSNVTKANCAIFDGVWVMSVKVCGILSVEVVA